MFHLLRRQVHSPNRKPLVVMTPKSLLRHKMAVSKLQDMATDSAFQAVINDAVIQTNAQKIVLCSGKIYYELLEQRPTDANIALIRIEELYPTPSEQLANILKHHPNASVTWCQEEPQNMGAWTHIYFALKTLGIDPEYIGRKPASSPSTGYTSVHQAEQSAIINAALDIKRT